MTEKAAAKRSRMKARLQAEQAKEKQSGKEAPSAPQLLFKEEAPKEPLPQRHESLVGKAVSAELHHQVAKGEEDNTGLQALHTTERTGESALHLARDVQEVRLRHQQPKQLPTGVHLHSQEQVASNATFKSSNPISRANQRRSIRREYLKAKTGRSASRHAQKAVGQTAKSAESTLVTVVRKKRALVVVALVAMLLFLMNALSSCAPLLEAGLQAFVMGTYPAEDADILAAERAYKAKEDGLKRELERHASYHPGYDEYVINADFADIWHDPYALISIISAYHGGEDWTIDDVQGTLNKLFDWQYTVTEDIASETRYRKETRAGTRLVTDPITGEVRTETYTHEVSVPYQYTTCAVTLKAEILSHAPVYIMSREKMGLYALYMSTLGNRPDLFAGNAHASTLKEPLRYDVPQTLLDADPQFALLVAEANKRLGYPYVWGGYDPSTSFDCSGFISWLFTSTGVNDIGHAGATGLYSRSTPVSPENAKPGDVIFFQGTMGEGTEGITHCGLYVGNNMMVHCGNPCSYADLTDRYWQQHFYGFGRLYDH